MPRIGKILSEMFGDENLKRAEKQENIFRLWPDIIREAFSTEQDNIQVDKIIENSKLLDISNGKIIVGTNHTGWLQILQTKKKELLNIILRYLDDIPINEIDIILKSP
jgi:hypothetical protein